jgi:2,4-dienoyl-CoA reductase-like NADH-dependent reductase (Old Yellow Enzyme family)
MKGKRSDMNHFEHVFQPVRLGPLTAKNRIEVSPAEPFLCGRDGFVTDEFIAFTSAMARGGAGIVTVGDSPVSPAYAAKNRFVVNLSDGDVVHGLTKLTDAVHRYGALASIELNLRDERRPEQLTVDEIRGLIKDFALAARRCRPGGLRYGHAGTWVTGTLLRAFIRSTGTGGWTPTGPGSFENRCRFANELIDAVRQEIGPSMAIEGARKRGRAVSRGGGASTRLFCSEGK